MKRFLKKIRRYRELKKKQLVGFSPSEETALLRLQKRRPDNQLLFQICLQIKKRYFFCEKKKIYGVSHVSKVFDETPIIALLSCGDDELISHYRLASEWNDFLTRLNNEYLSYQHEKRFLDSISASDGYHFDEDIYIAGKYTLIFSEEKARNIVCVFCPTPRHMVCIKKHNLTAVAETYRNLEETTQNLWQKIFKKDFTIQ